MVDLTEPRLKQQKRRRWRLPKWFLSKLIRWLLILGPLIYRLWRLVSRLFGTDSG